MDFVGIGIQFALLIIGFVFLIKGSDFFVDGSSNIAAILKIPTLIVGLTIVALGTSAPEAAISVTSSMTGSNALAVSNVIGSNLFNMMLIIGLCAVLNELKIGHDVLSKDLPFLLFITAAISAIIIFTWNISQIAGIGLLILMVIYIGFLVYNAKHTKEAEIVSKPKMSILRSIIYIICGVAGIIIGGDLVVDSASYIAMAFGMSETLVGLTIVAIGTSLPELVTSLTALKKDENQLIIGNVIGSNIFNILFVLGASSAISPIKVNPNMLVDVSLMLGVTILFYIFAKTQILSSDSDKTDYKYDKKEGIVLLVLFIAYMAFAILRN